MYKEKKNTLNYVIRNEDKDKKKGKKKKTQYIYIHVVIC